MVECLQGGSLLCKREIECCSDIFEVELYPLAVYLFYLKLGLLIGLFYLKYILLLLWFYYSKKLTRSDEGPTGTFYQFSEIESWGSTGPFPILITHAASDSSSSTGSNEALECLF